MWNSPVISLKNCGVPELIEQYRCKYYTTPEFNRLVAGLARGSTGGGQAMRPIELMKFLRQFTVLVLRNLRLIWNDKLLLASLVLQGAFHGVLSSGWWWTPTASPPTW